MEPTRTVRVCQDSSVERGLTYPLTSSTPSGSKAGLERVLGYQIGPRSVATREKLTTRHLSSVMTYLSLSSSWLFLPAPNKDTTVTPKDCWQKTRLEGDVKALNWHGSLEYERFATTIRRRNRNKRGVLPPNRLGRYKRQVFFRALPTLQLNASRQTKHGVEKSAVDDSLKYQSGTLPSWDGESTEEITCFERPFRSCAHRQVLSGLDVSLEELEIMSMMPLRRSAVVHDEDPNFPATRQSWLQLSNSSLGFRTGHRSQTRRRTCLGGFRCHSEKP